MTQTIIKQEREQTMKQLDEYTKHEYTTLLANKPLIAAMRDWIDCCSWSDLDSSEELSDIEVVYGINYKYSGGIAAFIRDGE
jgi:hypothetical protein